MSIIKGLILSNSHSNNLKGRSKLIIELQGGSPWFGYIWINDVCYTITQNPNSISIKKTKL